MDASPSQPPASGRLSTVAERALRHLFQGASLGFLVLDRAGRLLHANPRALVMLGAGEEDLPQIGLERLRHDLPSGPAQAWFETAFESRVDRSELGTWLRLDGTVLPVRLTVVGLTTEEGGHLFVWGRDQSEEQLIGARLAESAGLQRHLAEGIYALSLVRTREEAYRVLLGQATAILTGPHWSLGRIEVRDGHPKVILAAWSPSLAARLGPSLEGLEFPLADSGFAREVCEHRRMCFVEEASTSPSMIQPAIVATYGLRSLLGVPLVFEGRIAGVLFGATFQGEPPTTPRETMFPVLQSLARIAALALERLESEDRLEEAARLSRRLAQAVRDLAEAVDEEALIARLFRWAAKLAPFPEWWFNRYDPETKGSITTHWTPGLEALGSPEAIRQPVPVAGNAFLEAIHLQQEAVHVPQCHTMAESFDLAAWPFRSVVGLPLAHEGDVVGILHGGSFGEQGEVSLSDERFEALKSLAEAAGLVMKRLHARRALEAQETRFRMLFEQTPDPIVLLSGGQIADVNAAASRLFGLEREVMLGQPMLAFCPEWQPEGGSSEDLGRHHMEAAMRGTCEQFEWVFRCEGGREAICQVNLTRLDPEDRPLLHAIVRDITAQKRAESERVALERQLFQAQKMESLGVLAGGIAHDFNNLLMGVLGHAGLALEQLNPLHPIRRNLEAIQKAGQRAADLTRQMLAYSGRGQFVVRHLDLTTQVEEMLHLLEVSLPKTVVLNLDLKKGLPAVSADASQIQQVIMNLVINAAEAIGETSGAITLATGAQRLEEPGIRTMLVGQDVPPGIYVYLEVTDTGCGMDVDTMSRIFEPFFTTKFTGRGLGLSAIMGIVRGHKGALRVYSEVGQGTTFKVLFPAQSAMADIHAIPGREAAWEGTGLILVVDDDETVRTVAREALELRGFQVLEAEDGRMAVDLVREQGPAIGLVLLDMTMPRMGGEEAYREMRILQPDLRVILSSGYNEVEAMSRFMGKGLKGFIQKPYGPKDLLAKIQGALEA
ncbi:PAS domain S-box protein [Geothrix oryzae]|nr:PAS domain S-box protein [Geothrix oryzae]